MVRIVKSMLVWPIKWRYTHTEYINIRNIKLTVREHHWSKREDVAPSVDVTIATHWRPYVFFPPPADTLQLPSLMWDRKQWFLLNWPPCGASEERRLKDFVDGRRTMIPPPPPRCSDEPAGAAVRRSSDTPADLPTDASGFAARWLSCEGERWFASSLWYFQTPTRAKHTHTHTTLRQPHPYRHRRHLRQSAMAWICKSTSRGAQRDSVSLWPPDVLFSGETEEKRLH